MVIAIRPNQFPERISVSQEAFYSYPNDTTWYASIAFNISTNGTYTLTTQAKSSAVIQVNGKGQIIVDNGLTVNEHIQLLSGVNYITASIYNFEAALITGNTDGTWLSLQLVDSNNNTIISTSNLPSNNWMVSPTEPFIVYPQGIIPNAINNHNNDLNAHQVIKDEIEDYISNIDNQLKIIDNNLLYNSVSIGTIILYPISSLIPDGYLICNGSPINISDYPELYEIIGNQYGNNGTTFNLPNIVLTNNGNSFMTLIKAFNPNFN